MYATPAKTYNVTLLSNVDGSQAIYPVQTRWNIGKDFVTLDSIGQTGAAMANAETKGKKEYLAISCCEAA